MSQEQALPTTTRVIYSVFDFFGQYFGRILAGISVVVALGVLSTGVYIVKKEEQGVLTLFGKVVDAEVGPGVHYRIPVMQEIHIRKVRRVLGHQISSKKGDTVNFTLLSGDTNLLEVDLTLQYTIDNLRSYLFATSDPLLLMTMFAREELVDIVGRNFIDPILTSNREIVQRHLSAVVRSRLESQDAGIELVALNIVDVRPVEETLYAFRDVNDAIAERVQAVSEANHRKEHLIARTKGQAAALVMNARAKARERVVQAQSNAEVFTALPAEYRKNPSQVAITRYWQRMRAIFTEASLSAVNPGDESTIDMIDGLTGFRLPEMLSGAPLSGDAPDRPLPISTSEANVHTLESVEHDTPLFDGQFHKSRTERDHVTAADSRSLIFDTPSIFSHSHVLRSDGTTGQQPTIGVIAEESVEDDELENKEGHRESDD